MAMEDQMQAGSTEFEQALAELAQLLQRQQPITSAVPAKSGPMPKEGDRKWAEKLGEAGGYTGEQTTPLNALAQSFWKARDRVKDTSSGQLYKQYIDPTVTAIAEPSGVNTVNALSSLAVPALGTLPKSIVAPALVAGAGGALYQASNNDANAADSARDVFNRQYETRRPAPKDPGSEEDFKARKKAEIEQSAWYQKLLADGASTKTLQTRMDAELNKAVKGYPKAKADYGTDLEKWTQDRETAYNTDQADVYKKPWSQRNPELAQTALALGLSIPAVAGMTHMGSRISEKNALFKAAQTGDPTAINALTDYMSWSSRAGRAFDTAKTMAKTAPAPALSGLYGDWSDAKFAPADSEANKQARERMDVTDPESWKKQLLQRAPEAGYGLEAFGIGMGLRKIASSLGMEKAPSNSQIRGLLKSPPAPPNSTPPPLPPMPTPSAPSAPPDIDAAVEKALSGMKDAGGRIMVTTPQGNRFLSHDQARQIIRRSIENGQVP